MPVPRIRPGTRTEIGLVNTVITRAIGLVAGGGHPPNVFTTLARHRRLFRRWLRFAGAMMPGGDLPRDETELLILRVAVLTDSPYEWDQHARIARTAGLSAADVERVREGGGAAGWTPRQALLLRAADALLASHTLPDELWAPLAAELTERQLIELCLLVGHYSMLAMTLNALGVVPDAPAAGQAPKLLERLSRRRRV